MSEYEVKDYGIFDDAVSSTNTFGNSISTFKSSLESVRSTLSGGIFEGPASEKCMNIISSINKDIETMANNYNTISNYITSTNNNYQAGDQTANNAIIDGTSQTNSITTTNIESAPKSGVVSYSVGTLPTAGSQVSTLGKKATLLDVQVDGNSLGQDGSIVIKRGETVHLKVKVPDEIKGVQTLKRTSADGAKGWSQYVSQKNTPNVDKQDSSTYVDAREYDWYITGNTDVDNVTLSQTALFTVPGGSLGSYKGMVRVRVKIVD